MSVHLLVDALALGHLYAVQTVIECREPGLSIRCAEPTSQERVLERVGKGSLRRLAGNGNEIITHGTYRTVALLDMLSAQWPRRTTVMQEGLKER